VEGGEEPSEAAEPVGGVRGAEIDRGAEEVERRRGGDRRRTAIVCPTGSGEGFGGGGDFEGEIDVGLLEVVAFRGDLDEFALGVGEVDDDGAVIAGGGAAGNGDAVVKGVAGGVGLEVLADGGPGGAVGSLPMVPLSRAKYQSRKASERMGRER
jgi:hypothetical protein